jgi:hypothetical protein
VAGNVTNAKTKSTTINDNPKIKNSKLKKAIIPRLGSAAPMSHQPAPPSVSSELQAAIESAEAFRDLPLPYRDAKAIKKFQVTCYSGWMASSDIFDGFTIDSDVLLGIVQDAFSATWPNSPYVPCRQDVFHQIVSMI